MEKPNLASIRVITADIKRFVEFYESAVNTTATWYTEDFAEIKTATITLAACSIKTLQFFGETIARPASNQSVIIEFLMKNVDDDFERIKQLSADILQEPTTMPWGNRSLLFRDPDGNLINFFTPASPEAKKRFGLE